MSTAALLCFADLPPPPPVEKVGGTTVEGEKFAERRKKRRYGVGAVSGQSFHMGKRGGVRRSLSYLACGDGEAVGSRCIRVALDWGLCCSICEIQDKTLQTGGCWARRVVGRR